MRKIVFIGAGSMAEALIAGIIENKLIHCENIWVTNKSDHAKLQELESQYGVKTSYALEDVFQGADLVILAMKPKDAAEAITALKHYFTKEMLLISVLAGVGIGSIERLAGKNLALVRAMPNTSATIGMSATAIASNQHVTEAQLEMVQKLFETVGLTAIVEEEQLDAVTGLSGSGPAYIYYFAEAMEKSAMDIGLEKAVAKNLIVQTLLGAAQMLSQSQKEPQQLRKEVTSPGGTTEAGLKVLEAHGVQNALIACIKEATAQSKQLGISFDATMEAKLEPLEIVE